VPKYFETCTLRQVEVEHHQIGAGLPFGLDLVQQRNRLLSISDYGQIAFEVVFVDCLTHEFGVGRIVLDQQNAYRVL
jgi:hypothetical protein